MAIVVPAHQEKELICEVPLDQHAAIWEDTRAAYEQSPGGIFFKKYRIGGKTYKVNIANVRYHILLRDGQRCRCCGIYGTTLYLGKFEEDGGQQNGYNFQLFAESRSRPEEEGHLTLMTKDHVMPKAAGGGEEPSNLQCLCALCNYMKNECGQTLEMIRRIVFLGYRIHRSTLTLNKTHELLAKLVKKAEADRKMIENIAKGLPKITDPDRKEKVEAKMFEAIDRLRTYDAEIKSTEVTAQVSGMVPTEINSWWS